MVPCGSWAVITNGPEPTTLRKLPRSSAVLDSVLLARMPALKCEVARRMDVRGASKRNVTVFGSVTVAPA